MDKKDTINHIDDLVKRVTVVQGRGENRRTEVVFESDAAEEEDKSDEDEGADQNDQLSSNSH